MAKALPPLNWFRAFEAAARHLSFTAAAHDIGMTQSAVSQQIRSLELRLGVLLFERKPRGLALTDDARRLLPQVDAALATLTRATDAFLPEDTARILTIAASVSVIQWVILPRLPDFTNAHPDVSVRFVSAVWPDEFSGALADLEIRFVSRSMAGAGAELLGSDQLVALAAPEITGDLSQLPLIETVGTSDGWKAWTKATGATLREASLFVDSYGLAMQTAQHGNGVCLVSTLLAEPAVRAGTLKKVHSASIPGNEGYYMSVNTSGPATQVFKDWLLELTSVLGHPQG